ncbi:hypothetical protein JA1_002824 [Spathaspora sp. JA1]|nr:hypothetical protein JA1_002824 [Spathaspora sp. JA1]
MTDQNNISKKKGEGFLKVTRRLIVDFLLNLVTYLLIYNILFIFQIRNSLINANKMFFNLVLIGLELVLLLPFILIKFVYSITETKNNVKQMDSRFNSRGIIRTFTLHSLFWNYDNLSYQLELQSFSKRGGIHIFLQINDDDSSLEEQLQAKSIEEVRLEEISDDDQNEQIEISRELLESPAEPEKPFKGFHFGKTELNDKFQQYKIQFNNTFSKNKDPAPQQIEENITE